MYPIQKNIPPPVKTTKPFKHRELLDTLEKMEVGDSFVKKIDIYSKEFKTFRSTIYVWSKKHGGKQFSTASENAGTVRCWRIK